MTNAYGSLTYVKPAPSKSGHIMWELKCSCGKVVLVRRSSILSGNTTSCGCRSGRPVKHGLARHPLYIVWYGMIQRCTNPEHPAYKDYGGRGVTVCERWKLLPLFIEDMGPRPEGKTLDRFPDNNGNYEPGNCRWATPREQQSNTRRARIHTYNGVSDSESGWASRLGILQSSLSRKIRSGFSFIEAVDSLGAKAKLQLISQGN